VSNLTGISFHSTSTYTVLEEVGRGGMGIVFLAEKDNEGVKDRIILKTIKTLSGKHEERLKEEANVATGLRHENIVKTYGLESLPLSLLPISFRQEIDSLTPQRAHRHYNPYSQIDRVLKRKPQLLTAAKFMDHPKTDDKKLFFIAMDYIHGPDLATLHYEHTKMNLLIPYQLIGFVISRMCRALAYAHRFIIHRDISPENILINLHGVCKLSDFGVAAHTQEEMKVLAGKLRYMAPEQIQLDEIDHRIDIFALGLVAYELLTGVYLYDPPPGLPFEEKRQSVIREMAQEIIPPDQIRTDVPKELSLIVMKMLAKDKNQRYQSMLDVGDVIEQKYLYAKGFGPTNNSLAAYIQIFYNKFKKYNQEQLRQLSFLKNENGKLVLTRKTSSLLYTPAGQKFIMSRPDSLVAEGLSQ